MINENNPVVEKSEELKNWRYPSQNHKRGDQMESANSFKGNFSAFCFKTQKIKKKYIANYGDNWHGGLPMLYVEKEDCVYMDATDAHSIIFGSTGSKKTRLLVMPAVYLLGIAGESMIISDPKAEIYERTASELQQKGYEISVINLRDPMTGDQWNPLAIPYRFFVDGDHDRAYEFVNDIANNLMLSEKAVDDPYWDHSASDLLFGLIMLLFEYCKEHEYGPENVNMRSLQRLRVDLFKENAQSTDLWKFAQGNEIIVASLLGTINAPDKTQACILSVYDEKMRIFQMSSSLVSMLSGNDISFSNLANKKQVIYLIMPDEKTSYHRLVSLFIKQSYEYLIYLAQTRETAILNQRVNYILDEFSSLPRITDFSTMISAARSRNIRFHLVVQSKHQLVQKYNDDEPTIMSNCLNWFFLASRELELLKEISELCGEDKSGRAIVTIQELQRLNKDKGECLILSGRLKPFISVLLDIDGYDHGQFIVKELKERSDLPVPELGIGGFVIKERTSEKSFDVEAETDDIQKLLEAKFDELFGSAMKREDEECNE